nr:hypothetical protein [Tanacetum cinerariifolium]
MSFHEALDLIFELDETMVGCTRDILRQRDCLDQFSEVPWVILESFSPSPILVKDSDSLMEKIDLFCTPDHPMPSGIEDKDHDSKRDILIPKDLPSNNSLSFAKKESFHFDIPLFSRPPTKPPDGDTGILNIKMMGDIYDQKAFMHKFIITLAPHQEKSPDLYLIKQSSLGCSVVPFSSPLIRSSFPYGGIDMVIKDLDLEPKIDAMMREFLYPPRKKELSKETSSKILPDDVRSQRYHIVPIEELNGVLIALVARFGVVSKSTNRIFISHEALGWILEEIHVIWAHLEKKRTILRLYTKSLGRIRIQCVETTVPSIATTSNHTRDDVRILKMASKSNCLKRNPISFIKETASEML